MVADRVPYFLNTVYLGQRGRVLLGQEKAEKTEGAFKGDIYEMQLRGNSLVADRCGQYSNRDATYSILQKRTSKNDHLEEFITLDDSHNLTILSAAGDRIWKAARIFGATTNTFESKVEDRRFNLVDIFAIHSPILITDLNNDGIAEIVLNRNTTILTSSCPIR